MAQVGAQEVSWETRRKVPRHKLVKCAEEWAEVKEQRAAMIEFVHEYGAGVRQSTCRSKTTKHEPGTLPLALSSATRADLGQNTTLFTEPSGALAVPVNGGAASTMPLFIYIRDLIENIDIITARSFIALEYG